MVYGVVLFCFVCLCVCYVFACDVLCDVVCSFCVSVCVRLLIWLCEFKKWCAVVWFVLGVFCVCGCEA